MKKLVSMLFAIVLSGNICYGQNLINVFTVEGKIFVQFDNGISKQVISEGENKLVTFSKKKNIIVYKKLEHNSRYIKPKEGIPPYNQFSIHCFDLTNSKNELLFLTCLDGVGGTKPVYANTNIYPNNNLCGFTSGMLSTDGKRLYFETDGWTVCPAIHYYAFEEGKLVFFKAGWLENVTKEGVEIEITGTKRKGGRYTQRCLFDSSGSLIKELSPKEF